MSEIAGQEEAAGKLAKAVRGFVPAEPSPGAQDSPCFQGSWREALLGAGPFLVAGLSILSSYLPRMWLGVLAASYLIVLAGLGAGWVGNFPRWSYVYGGMVLPFTGWWMGLVGLRHWILQVDVCLPLLTVIVIAIRLTGSLKALYLFLLQGWRDWTRFSFGLYGLLALLLVIPMGEGERPYGPPYAIAATLVLAGGALLYMRARLSWQRVLALLGGELAAWVVATAGTAMAWNGAGAPVALALANVPEAARETATYWALLALIVLAPAILAPVRWVVQRLRRPSWPRPR